MLTRYADYKKADATVGYHMKHLKPFFENIFFSQISNQVMREYAERRSLQRVTRGNKKGDGTVSMATIRRELDTLSAAFGFARREGYIKEVPHIEKPVASPPRERWLTHEEAGKLLVAAQDNKRLLLFIQIAMNTGARPSSILELKWFQIDLPSRLIHFNPEGRAQTHKYRPTVYINDGLLVALKTAKKSSEYVLGGIKSVKHAFRRACERAKIKGVTPYTLRHTAITWAIRDGHSLALAGQLAGHRDPRTTMRYAKHDPSFTKDITSSLATGVLLAQKSAKKGKKPKIAANKRLKKQ